MPNALNIAFPIVKGSDGAFKTNSDTLSAITDDLRILLLTNHGERPCNFNFGANLRGLVFEAEGNLLEQAIKDRIQVAIDTYMPFVKIQRMTVDTQATSPNVAENQIQIFIAFTVGAIPQVATLTQNLNKG